MKYAYIKECENREIELIVKINIDSILVYKLYFMMEFWVFRLIVVITSSSRVDSGHVHACQRVIIIQMPS